MRPSFLACLLGGLLLVASAADAAAPLIPAEDNHGAPRRALLKDAGSANRLRKAAVPAAAAPGPAPAKSSDEAPAPASSRDPTAAVMDVAPQPGPNSVHDSLAEPAANLALPTLLDPNQPLVPEAPAANAMSKPARQPRSRGFSFPWRKFWIITGFICAGACGVGLLFGFTAAVAHSFNCCKDSCCEDGSSGASYSSGGSSYGSSYGSSSGSCHGDGEGMLACCLCGLALMLAVIALAIYSVMPALASAIGYGVGYALGFLVTAVPTLLCPCTRSCHARRAAWCTAPARPADATVEPPPVQLPSAKVTSEDGKPGGTAGREELFTVDPITTPPLPAVMLV